MPQYIIESFTMNNKDEGGPSSMESNLNDLSVVEVYDLASDIGRECEKIIDEYGAAAVSQLIPKVINALEKLEYLASQNERENSTMEELNHRIHCLETEKNEKAEYRKRFDKVSLMAINLFVIAAVVVAAHFLSGNSVAVLIIDCCHFFVYSTLRPHRHHAIFIIIVQYVM